MQGTIKNCVSYADVYGTDYVGGIIGTRDNAMGTCEVIGSEFYGTVTASGQHAGGIVGGGYDALVVVSLVVAVIVAIIAKFGSQLF